MRLTPGSSRDKGFSVPGNLALLAASLVFGFLLFSLISEKILASPTHSPPCPNCSIVLVVVDALRKDSLSCYGAPEEASPAAGRFCAESSVFSKHISSSTWTLPSIASLLTSVSSSQMPSRVNISPIFSGRDICAPTPKGSTTLGQVLQARGYSTAAIVSNDLLAGELGFSRGFSDYSMTGGDDVLAADLASEYIMNSSAKGRKFFLYVHLLAPHTPYDPPKEILTRLWNSASLPAPSGRIDFSSTHQGKFLELNLTSAELAELRIRYRAEVLFADSLFQRILDSISSSGIGNETIVILTADHGERLGENGAYGHGDPDEEVLSIPLAIRSPREPPKRISEFTQAQDVAPTVLSLLGISSPSSFQGRPVLSEGFEGGPVVFEEYNGECFWVRGYFRDYVALADRGCGADEPEPVFVGLPKGEAPPAELVQSLAAVRMKLSKESIPPCESYESALLENSLGKLGYLD